jgi:hypothetical protein
MVNPGLFPSFFLGGFECSTHRRFDGVRLDLINSTRHDVFAAQDYRLLQNFGMNGARDGIRWHLIEAEAGRYDWKSALPQICAASATNHTVIWDVLHYGWPDHLDIWSPQWVDSFARFAGAFARLLRDETDGPFFFAPVNETSFFSFAGAGHGFFAPYAKERGLELKKQLVRASLAAIDAIWDVLPQARIVHTDPLIHVVAPHDRPEQKHLAERENEWQFQAWDMIEGRLFPELGGHPRYLDIIGANYYVHNQWHHPGGHGTMIPPSHPQHLRLRYLLEGVWNRYQRPVFLAETGIEEEARAEWLRYIGGEVRAAMLHGVLMEGICLYPICNHPGWDNDRHCHNGLFDYPGENGEREVYEPLARELERQIALTDDFIAASPYERERLVESEAPTAILDEAAREMEALAVV